MTLVVLLGGARSGKSSLAVSLVRERGAPVSLLVTAEPRDEEMRLRIEAHRAARPADWRTIEEPVDVSAALAQIPAADSVVLDCLSLWVSNLLERGDDREAILAAGADAAAAAAARPSLTVAVSNEVGLGIVPATPIGRVYRDLLGEMNRLWVDAAAEAAFVVAGRRLRLE